MDNSIKIFKNDVFGEVRVAGTSEEPLFCLADVCNAVELSNPSSVKTRLNDEDLRLLDLHALNPDLYVNGNSFATFITESAFYDVLLFSSSKKVKPYRRWVTHEILPSIRKYGAHMTSDTIEKALASPDFLIQLATTLKEEKQKRIEAEKKVEEQAPKVLFADAVIRSRSSCLIGEPAKIISQNGFHVGQNRLFERLRNNHYSGSVGERGNIPNRQYVGQEPKQNLSDLQFVASLQHKIDILESFIKHSLFNIYVNKFHCEHFEVDIDKQTGNDYASVDEFIRYIHEKHPEILDEFRGHC